MALVNNRKSLFKGEKKKLNILTSDNKYKCKNYWI